MLSQILDAIYPPKCAVCGALGPDPVCAICYSHFERHDPVMHVMEQPLDFAGAIFDYTGFAAQAVQNLKYKRDTSLAHWMAKLLREGAEERGVLDVDAVVPVPIHWRREALRGFNQAELLCEELPSSLVRTDLLIRARATRPQVGLSEEERAQNLEGAFECRADVVGLNVLLVDDVLTSGGTATACAKALKAAGAAEVSILTFAGEHRWRA